MAEGEASKCGDLSAHPRHALFWTFVAPFLYPALIIFLAANASGMVAEAFKADTAAGNTVRWLTLLLANTLVLGHMMHWAQSVRATPFAARVRTQVSWCFLALIGGPVLMFGASFLVDVFQSGAVENWAYRGGEGAAPLAENSVIGFSVFYFIILKPLIEEIGFRAIGYGCLRDGGVSAGLTIFLTSAGFALIHAFEYTVMALIPIFILGLFLGWLRLASKSIAAPILAHMAVNLQALLMVGALN